MDGSAAPMLADLDDNVAGATCNSDADCGGENAKCATTIGGIDFMGMSIGGTPAPDGYCTGACADDSNCGAGGVCAGALGGFLNGTCQAACEEDTDCREGQICNAGFQIPDGGIPMGDGGMGLPGGGGMQLPPQPSTCLPKPEVDQLADNKAGSACSTDADCGGGTCADMIGGFEIFGQLVGATAAPGKYCTGRCTEDAQCGAGGTCVVVFGGAGSCYGSCMEDDDCTRDGYTCSAPFGGGMGGGMGGGGMGGGMGGANVPDVCFPGEDDPADAGT
jgi:hypothetical protein